SARCSLRLVPRSFRMLRPPPSAPRFPYTTLFRSPVSDTSGADAEPTRGALALPLGPHPAQPLDQHRIVAQRLGPVDQVGEQLVRSEEHTSELQSREKLVCRLLLDKKNESRNASLL